MGLGILVFAVNVMCGEPSDGSSQELKVVKGWPFQAHRGGTGNEIHPSGPRHFD